MVFKMPFSQLLQRDFDNGNNNNNNNNNTPWGLLPTEIRVFDGKQGPSIDGGKAVFPSVHYLETPSTVKKKKGLCNNRTHSRMGF
jgi:hypothetical protein